MKKISKAKRFWKNLFLVGASFFIILCGIILIYLATIKIPDFRSFEDRKVSNSTRIYDSTGTILLYDIHNDVKRTDVNFADMSINIKNATVAVEDAEFYTHSGIKITSIIRAIIANVFHTGQTQGGSTITQQLVKNTLLTSQRSIGRKIKEWILAIKIDRSMPKEKILEAYLNEAPYGGQLYGIEEAAKTYFNKNASELTLAEAAYLAAIPQSPTVLSPYGKHKDKLEERKNFVLSRMLTVKMITQAEYESAKKEIVSFQPQSTGIIKAPHFIFFIKDYLEQKYGADLVENGGLKVITTLNYDLQQKAEQIVKAGALQNEKDWNGSNAALVAIDPKTGGILTMVGSRDYFDKNIDGNFNVATATRQPGSSFKPFIYATAFEKGFTPNTVLFDLPTEFQSGCDAYGKALPGHSQSKCYMPDNYDGKFRGPMSLRNALAQSINVPAVQLFYLAGMKDSLKTAEDMGITTLKDGSVYGLTLVIGGGEVSLLDETSAYSVFANEGVRNPYTGIIQVQDSNGNILEQSTLNPQNVLTKNVALTMSDVLSDNTARIPTFGAHSALVVDGKDVAVKTGTTNSNKDAWTVGYSPNIAVGVWAGNNDNKPMKKGGAAVAGPIWHDFIAYALSTLPDQKFEKPDLNYDPTTVKPVLRGIWQGNQNFFIDRISGLLATANTPAETKIEKVITNPHSILYWIDKNNILGDAPSNPSDDSEYNHFEIPFQNWWATHKNNYSVTTMASIPTATDNIHTDANRPVVTITNPIDSQSYPANLPINLTISNTGLYALSKIDIFINDNYVGTSRAPFYFSFTPNELDNLKEINELKVIAYDTAYNKTEVTSNFSVTQ